MSERANEASASDASATCIDELLSVESARQINTAPDVETFVGAPRDYGPLRIYGGHFLGQALAAAFRTVPEARLAHSLHGYFPRAGIPNQPIEYQVERLRDGGGYVTRAAERLQQCALAYLSDSTLVATAAQEGMMRRTAPTT
jgi:acyl-CoA thioesterase